MDTDPKPCPALLGDNQIGCPEVKVL